MLYFHGIFSGVFFIYVIEPTEPSRTALYIDKNDRPMVGPKPTFRIDLPVGRTGERTGGNFLKD